MRELQAREAARPRPEPESEPARPREQQQGLEKVRQQLLCAAGLLTSFINQTVDRQVSRDCPGHMPSTFDVGKNSEWGVSLISGSGFHETHSISHPTCVDELVGSILLKDDDSIVVFAFSCDRKSRCLSDRSQDHRTRPSPSPQQHMTKGLFTAIPFTKFIMSCTQG